MEPEESHKWILVSLLVILIAGISLAQNSEYELRFFLDSPRTIVYRYYIQGKLETSTELRNIHFQFLDHFEIKERLRNSKSYVVQEWGTRYQGTEFNFRALGLPVSGEKLERYMDQMGRVERVLHYPPGHPYYSLPVVFTSHTVRVGQIWKYGFSLSVDIAQRTLTLPCETYYSLDNVLLYKGRTCAKIIINGSCNSPKDSQLKYSSSVNGKLFFDIEKGQIMDFQLTRKWFKQDAQTGLLENLEVEIYSLFEKELKPPLKEGQPKQASEKGSR